MSLQEVPKAPARSSQQLQGEFQQLALRAGSIAYAIKENQRDLDLIQGQMRDLSLEFVTVKSREEEEAKKSAEAPKAAEGAST